MTNIEASAPELAAALRIGATIVTGHEHIPLLNNMRLAAEDGRASLSFTDLDVWLTTSIPAKSDEATTTTIPAALFTKAVGSIDGDAVKLAVNGARVTLTAARAKFQLPTLPAEGFPSPKTEDAAAGGTAKASALLSALEAVSYAMPGDGIMHVQAVHFEAVGADGVEVASFDGKRLALDSFSYSGDALQPFSLPRKAAAALVRLCQNAPAAEVEFQVGASLARFNCGGWQMTAKLADPKFPDYRRLLDTADKASVQFDPRIMERALGRLAIMADGRTEGLRFIVAEDRITLNLVNQKTGEATEEVPAAYVGEERILGFRLTFLRDAMRHLTGDTVQMFLDPYIDAATNSPQVRAILESFDPQSTSRHFFASYAL